MKLTDAVEFLGYVSTKEIVTQLVDAQCPLIPSYIENSPNNLAEALAVGTPTVASSAGGIPSMLKDGDEGLLFNVGDAAMLALSLYRLFTNDDLSRRISQAARQSMLIATILHRLLIHTSKPVNVYCPADQVVASHQYRLRFMYSRQMSPGPWIAYVGFFRFPTGEATSQRVKGVASSIADVGYRVVVGSRSSEPATLQQLPETSADVKFVGIGEIPEEASRPLKAIQ